jgi:hypothetical protein
MVMKASGKPTKYVRFEHAGAVSYGILESDVVKELEGSIFEDAASTGRAFPVSQIRLLVPCEPSKVIAVGLNYASQAPRALS